MLKRGKAQAAMEFFLTYGWAILIITIAIVSLAYFGVLSPGKFLSQKCAIATGSGLFCNDYAAYSSGETPGVTLRLKNILTKSVTVFNVTITDPSTTCSWSELDGKSISAEGIDNFVTTCDPVLDSGQKIKGEISIVYSKAGGLKKTTTGNIVVKSSVGGGVSQQTCLEQNGYCCDGGGICPGTTISSSDCAICCDQTCTCSDGTPYGQCSVTKPKYCQDGTLIDDCNTCGCDTGETCQPDGTCVVVTCTGQGYKCCDACEPGTEQTDYDDDCTPQFCCSSCQMPLPADWLVINSTYIDSFCGEEGDGRIADALNGTGIWRHATTETHWMILDLGQTYTIKKVRGRSNAARDPTNVDIYVSDDKGDWGTAAADITTWQDTSSWVEIDSTDKDGRYIKVEVESTEHASEYLGWGHATTPFTIFDAYGEVWQ